MVKRVIFRSGCDVASSKFNFHSDLAEAGAGVGAEGTETEELAEEELAEEVAGVVDYFNVFKVVSLILRS